MHAQIIVPLFRGCSESSFSSPGGAPPAALLEMYAAQFLESVAFGELVEVTKIIVRRTTKESENYNA
jgi:hypothetical protein